MRLKFAYQRPGGSTTDLVAELEARATVGDLAGHLAAADPHHAAPSEQAVTLALAGPAGRLLDASTRVGDAGVASGATVTVVPAPQTYAPSGADDDAVVQLRVISGPDRGREFRLRDGAALLGRERGCQVQLTDELVSRNHARLNIGDGIEVIDLASANGLEVGGVPVERAQLASGDTVTLGETTVEVIRLRRADRTAGWVPFIRPARVVPVHEGREFDAPSPPERTRAQRFPTIALVIPIIMGGILYLTTHQLASIIFIALSPLMLIGNAVEARLVNKREFKRAVEEFESDLSALEDSVSQEHAAEVVARLLEHPSTQECLEAVRQRSDLLWCRRPDLPGFTELRLGLGRAASRSSIKLPAASRAPYELVQRMEEVVVSHRDVDGVPIVGDLAAAAVGVAGPRGLAVSAARALVLQVVALHSPAELAVAALLGADSAADWDWLKWVPHTSSPHSPLTGRHLVATQDATLLVGQLEALVTQRAGSDEPTAPRVVVVVDRSQVPHSRLIGLAEQGPAVGIHVVWVASGRAEVPAACKAVVELSGTKQDGTIGFVVEGEELTPVVVDLVEGAVALEVARALAPVEDIGAHLADDSDLPRTVSQFETLQDTRLATRPESVIERWQSSNSILTGPYAREERLKKAGTLRAVVGMSADGPHTLDLRSDGPHALVGGSTNSGKSELLQSWILAMAATHSPERVTFLLVDYKGGSAFADCVELPHTVGLVTDLSQHMVRRALTSLSAELRHRERLLHEHGVKDLIEMEKHGIPGAPPSLVIVVDEFAALVTEVPEFIDGMINVAARGRSLGLHLILATQQPSGVIKGSLRANTNLRLALRVTDENDSLDVLGAPDAADFDPQIPGRAMSRSGPKRLVAFQTSYAGGWTSDEPEPPQISVEELTLSAPLVWQRPEVEAAPKDRDATDIKRLVRTIVEANGTAQLPPPRKPWLPVLPEAVDVSTLPRSRRDNQLVFGLGDDPEAQEQPPVVFRPDQEGSLAVYGASGSGKSTLLRALAVACGFTQRGGPCHVYGLDFGSRALQMLEVLPHVGSIIAGSDGERVERALDWLRAVIEDRRVRFAAANASTLTEYRVKASQPDEPRVLLLVDNVGAFRATYEATDKQRYLDLLASIASEGRAVGVHVAVSAAERTAIPTTLASALQRRIVMRMASDDDYGMLGVPMDVLNTQSSPGRAIDGDDEIQVGILGLDHDPASQAARLADLAVALTAAGVTAAPPVQSLATDVVLTELGRTIEEVPLGIAGASLQPVGVAATGTFLLTGPPGSGRSSALMTLVESARQSLAGAELHYIGSRRSVLAQWSNWTTTSTTAEEITETAQSLADRLLASSGDPRTVVVVERAGEFVMGAAESALQALAKACNEAGHWFIAEGEMSTVRSTSGFLGIVKSTRTGLVLQPDQDTGLGLFSTPFPRIRRVDFPPGRGFLVSKGRAGIVQVARVGVDG